jgi:Ca2+-binding EF-hand superfamily protein
MPHEDKEAFLDACRRDGRTASDVVRELIGGYVRRAEVRARLRDIQPERSLAMIWKSPKTRIAAGASAAAAALASVALLSAPSVAQFDYRASFERLDANRDGVITLEEYAGGGSLSTLELDLELPLGSDGLPQPIAGEAVRVVMAPGEAGASPDVVEFTLGPAPEELRDQQSVMRWSLMMDIGFGVADADGDGSVDFDEFVDRHQQLLANEFTRRDVDADGRLTSSELQGDPAAADEAPGPSPLFDALDLDGDGAITLEELQAEPA